MERLRKAGVPVRQACRRVGVSAPTFYRWRNRYSGQTEQAIAAIELDARRLRETQRRLEIEMERRRILEAALSHLFLSPSRRRELVRVVQRTLSVSERATCRALGQPRSGLRSERTIPSRQQRLVERLLYLAADRPRFGYRRITLLLQEEGWPVEPWRIYRLWRREGLQVRPVSCPQRSGRRRALASQRRSRRMDDIWAWDLMHGTDSAGRPLVWLSLLDEFTRECLSLHVARVIVTEDVRRTIQKVVVVRGRPTAVRSDNELLWRERSLREWLARNGIEFLRIAPGAPWQNCWIEAFQSRLRDELVGCTWFENLVDARNHTMVWQAHYNEKRPHSALGNLPPTRFAMTLLRNSNRASR